MMLLQIKGVSASEDTLTWTVGQIKTSKVDAKALVAHLKAGGKRVFFVPDEWLPALRWELKATVPGSGSSETHLEYVPTLDPLLLVGHLLATSPLATIYHFREIFAKEIPDIQPVRLETDEKGWIEGCLLVDDRLQPVN